jgi:uncharacterized protein (TIGR02266 family)
MDQPTSKEPRGPVSLRIKFRSASLDQFIERYAVDVSRGGIFIRTREPLAVGTPLRFDFQLQDGSALLAGDGTIVWIRENDPSRAGVTPGMGVRFDKLSSTSQPVLEKILAEKARREQSGAPAKPAPGGIAVRRPSSTFSALEPAAARAAQAPSAPPRVGGLSPLGAQPRAAAAPTGSAPLATGAQPRAAAAPTGSAPLATGAQPRAAAPGGGTGPLGSQPRTTAPAIGSDAFGTGRTTGASGLPRTSENPIPAGVPGLEGSGAFGRPRATTGSNAQRPAPAPSALFEKPTADDIDRALSVLTEVDGPPPSFSQPEEPAGRVRRPTDAQPVVLEAAPDVGTAPVAAHRRPTDAQPVVLEASPDLGDAPARKSTGTRPLFSGTGETKIPTVPVATLGDAGLADDDEDDATSAWVGSGPTRAGGSDPELPAAAAAPTKETTAPPAKVDEPPGAPPAKAPELPAAPPATGLDPAALPAKAPSEPPILMTPNFVAPSAAPKKAEKKAAKQAEKKGSGASVVIVGVLLAAAAAGGGFLYLKGPNRAPAPESRTAAVAPPEAAPTPPAAAEGPAPSPAPGAAGAPSAAEKPAQPENAAAPAPAVGGTATPSTLRARPEGEAPPAPSAPAEAKPDDKAAEKAAEARERRHRRREERAAENAAPEKTEPAKTEAAAAPAEAAAPAAAEAKAPAASGHLLKITSSPAGAEVIIDGTSMGTTPFSNGEVDPALPHSVTIKKDGFEAYEHMIGGSDWPQPKKGVRTLKLNAKLRATGGGANETAKPAEPTAPAEPPPGLGTTPASPKRE